MKQTIKFGKARLARYGIPRVQSYTPDSRRYLVVRAGVVQVKSL